MSFLLPRRAASDSPSLLIRSALHSSEALLPWVLRRYLFICGLASATRGSTASSGPRRIGIPAQVISDPRYPLVCELGSGSHTGYVVYMTLYTESGTRAKRVARVRALPTCIGAHRCMKPCRVPRTTARYIMNTWAVSCPSYPDVLAMLPHT